MKMIVEDEILAGFSALSDPSRLHILRMLVDKGDEGSPAGEIARGLGASPSRTSFHLAALSRAGLVRSKRQGRGVIYSVRMDKVGDLVSWLIEDCCANDSTLRAAACR